MSKLGKPETALRDAIHETLLRCGIAVMPNSQVGRTYKGGLGVGSADLIICLKPFGRLVGLEVKTEKGAPSAQQLAWGEWITEHGGGYYIVRSVAEALAALRSAGWRK